MFIEIPAATFVNMGDGRITQAGGGRVLNSQHIRYAHFRESTTKETAGMGASSTLLLEGTPCVDIWTDGNLTDRPALTLYFPEEVHGEYQKLRRLLTTEP